MEENNKKSAFAMTDVTAEFEQEDITANKAMGILSYLWLLVLVPIFAAKDSKYARFNANQGLVITIAYVALNIINLLLKKIPVLGTIISIVCALAQIGLVVLYVFGIVNVAKGTAKKLPFVGDIKILK